MADLAVTAETVQTVQTAAMVVPAACSGTAEPAV
jgi:hypothetical protein